MGTVGMMRRHILIAVPVLVGALTIVGVGWLTHDTGSRQSSSRIDAPAPVKPFAPDGTTLDSCTDRHVRCIVQAYGNIALRHGPRTALSRLQNQLGDPEVERICHSIAHEIGRATIARYDGDTALAYREGSPLCASGYYHGILERSLNGVGIEALGERAHELCSSAQLATTVGEREQCVHGIGHGVFVYTSFDLPTSLEVCRQLHDLDPTGSCAGGVFMENIDGLPKRVPGRWLKDDDYEYPCNVVDHTFKHACYVQYVSRVQRMGIELDDILRRCVTIEPEFRSTCVEAVGNLAPNQLGYDSPDVLDLCADAGPQQRTCLMGAVGAIAVNDLQGARAARLCSRAPRWFDDQCYGLIGNMFQQYVADPVERRTRCQQVAADHVRSCLRGYPGKPTPPESEGPT